LVGQIGASQGNSISEVGWILEFIQVKAVAKLEPKGEADESRHKFKEIFRS
jgi:hypothetical protein